MTLTREMMRRTIETMKARSYDYTAEVVVSPQQAEQLRDLFAPEVVRTVREEG